MFKNKWLKFVVGGVAMVSFVFFGSLGISAVVGAGLASAALSMLLGIISGLAYGAWAIEKFDLF